MLFCFLSNFSGIKIYMQVGVTGGRWKKDSVLEAQTSDLRQDKSMHFAFGRLSLQDWPPCLSPSHSPFSVWGGGKLPIPLLVLMAG